MKSEEINTEITWLNSFLVILLDIKLNLYLTKLFW